MKIQLLFLPFAITLLTSCNSFDTVVTKLGKCGDEHPDYQTVYFTNNSKSRFLEVTIKIQKGEDSETLIRQLRPGEQKDIWVLCGEKADIVGEREITSDE